MHGRQFQPLMDGVKDQFQAVGNPDLIVDGAEMVLDRLLGDRKVGADFPVAPALHQVADDDLLPASQRIDGAGWMVSVRLEKFRHGGNVLLGDPRLPCGNAAGAFDEKLWVNRLENHPGGAIANMAHR